MNIININVTDGPNYWSVNRHRLVVMQLDLEEMESRPTDSIPGFRERIEKVLPGLHDHHCSEGHAGGFLARVERGTWMGHVIEHIALELQTLADFEVSFGRTRGTGNEGEYHVVFDCIDEESGRLTAKVAVEMARNLVDGETIDVPSLVEEIKSMNGRYKPGPSTESLLEEAHSRGIPSIRLEDSSTHQLGYSAQQQKIAATIVSTTGSMAVETACDKQACRRIFKEMAVPVAKGAVVYNHDELHNLADDLGFPLVVKPISGNHGRAVTTNITSTELLDKAFDSATEISDAVLVERHISGNDYRLLVVNHKLAAAAKRTPAHVVGNGSSTIKELIKQVNADPNRGDGHNNVLTKITVGNSARSILKRKDYTLNTVLPTDEVLYLDHAANLSKGGTATDVTHLLHPSIIDTAERISQLIGLDICGIDLMASSVEQPLHQTNGVVLEVNAAPGLRMHASPSEGESRDVAKPIVDMLFPNQSTGRIPIIAVTGTNGKTTTTRIISHIMQHHGRRVGYTTTDGIYINDRLMMSGDCGGPKSARFVLKDPTVNTAVLECARGGILRSGLGFDHCDVAVVTNITSDHLGLKGINSIEKMARVKSVVPESVGPGGHAVLNADDDYVYAMKDNVEAEIVLYSANAKNKRIKQHHDSGGICVIYQNGTLIIQDGSDTHEVEEVENIPLSFGGRAQFMIENILAATAAAYVQQVPLSTIRKGLHNFKPSPEQTPGRMNLFNFDTFDVMIDYAHNAAGLRAVKDFIDRSSYTKTVGIIAAVGDRRDEDIKELGQVAANLFDQIIIREDSDLRGKSPGESSKILKAGITQAKGKPPVEMIADEKEAIRYAINHATPGSLIMLCVEKVSETITLIRQLQNKPVEE